MHNKKDFLNFIENEISKGNLAVVEGKKDFDALIKIGFSNKDIFVLNNGKSFIRNIEEIDSLSDKKRCKIAILTDLDKKGKLLYGRIKESLLHKEKIDDSLRLELFKQKISHIEGLYSYLNA